MTEALQFEGIEQFLLMIMFKESAKTSWARIAIVWRICHNLSHFICFICHDEKKAAGHLFDIAVALQTNPRILNDFGQLFYDSGLIKQSQKKSMKEFVTAHGIKVKAYSTSMSIRGELHKTFRPDWINFDDIENVKTKGSKARVKEVKEFIDETLSGISAAAKVVISANRIDNNGSIVWLERKAMNNPDFKVLEKKLIEDGKIVWPARFVWTDKEKIQINAKVSDPLQQVFSIEERRRTLSTRKFNQEYQNIPVSDEDSIIKKEWIDRNEYDLLPNENRMQKVLMMDPQTGEKGSSDFYAIVLLGYYPKDRHRYVLELRKGRASKLEQAAELVKMYQDNKEGLWICGVEHILTQVAVYQNVLEWISGRIDLPGVDNDNRHIPLTKVNPKGKKKGPRLAAHEAAFERGEVHLHIGMKELKEQLIGFPEIEHDDDVDALIYCLDWSYKSIALPSGKKSVKNRGRGKAATFGQIETAQF
ncbi:MAG: hypothetical protein V3T43_06320 [Nitrosomonadaceae bacterium]